MSPIEHNPGEVLPEESAYYDLETYKTLRQITSTDATRDAQLELAIEIAEDVVEQYTGRDFRTEPTALTKKYRYDGSGIVDIDDCATITSVKIDGRELVPDIDFCAGPVRGPTFFWLELAERGTFPSESAGEMGFTSNLDTYPWRHSRIVFVEVSAEFGWPRNKIPGSIKQATTWLVDEFAAEAVGATGTGGKQITSEQIADLGYGYQIEESSENALAELSPRIRALLDQFTKVEI